MKKNIYLSLPQEMYEALLALLPVLQVSSVQKVIRKLLEESLKIHDAKK